MGNRANVYVHAGEQPGVYLYTHWAGDELPATVRTALAREQRWEDDQYLARIIFNTMTLGDEAGETGFGISAYPGDGGSRIVDVDTSAQSVRVFDEQPQSFGDFVLQQTEIVETSTWDHAEGGAR